MTTLEPMISKRPSDSRVVMTQLVLPTHTNQLGSLFGGTVMAWIDICGAISAFRHVGGEVVTASVDDLHFLAPIYAGWIVELTGQVFYTGTTSLDIFVKVIAENPKTQIKSKTATCFLTFVSRDEEGKPKAVPPLLLESETDKKHFEIAKKRRELRRKRHELSVEIYDF